MEVNSGRCGERREIFVRARVVLCCVRNFQEEILHWSNQEEKASGSIRRRCFFNPVNGWCLNLLLTFVCWIDVAAYAKRLPIFIGREKPGSETRTGSGKFLNKTLVSTRGGTTFNAFQCFSFLLIS